MTKKIVLFRKMTKEKTSMVLIDDRTWSEYDAATNNEYDIVSGFETAELGAKSRPQYQSNIRCLAPSITSDFPMRIIT